MQLLTTSVYLFISEGNQEAEEYCPRLSLYVHISHHHHHHLGTTFTKTVDKQVLYHETGNLPLLQWTSDSVQL